MRYLSTRDSSLRFSAAEAIVQGLSRDGGLLTPESIPALSPGDLEALGAMDYRQRAVYVMSLFLDDFSKEELEDYAAKAYARFDSERVAPVTRLSSGVGILELWHGPTCAFKDMALQMLPYLLTASLKKTGESKTVCILVATSGDTGKAALEGFKDVDKTKIFVFYPKDGVSDIQKLQMTTQEGENVGVCAVYGNFDDAQSGVKAIFSDPELRAVLESEGFFFSSANSINWGRVLPQIAYYVSAYCDMVAGGAVKSGQSVNFCVPTGNFGNILAGYYAKLMGVPIARLICASNENNVLTDFIKTGVYDKNRPFHTTTSPSMDILISSNLERLLFKLSGSDTQVAGYMAELAKTGRYEVSEDVKKAVSENFYADYCDDKGAADAIARVYKSENYLMDTHTAVAYSVYEKYVRDTGDRTPTVVVSTASPFKFCDSVLGALGQEEPAPGVEVISQLARVSGAAAPEPLLALEGKPVRFTQCVEKSGMAEAVLKMLRA